MHQPSVRSSSNNSSFFFDKSPLCSLQCVPKGLDRFLEDNKKSQENLASREEMNRQEDTTMFVYLAQ